MDALIGYTGFVGQNLSAEGSFTHFFNSANIDKSSEKSFRLLVCAGARAEKWKANQNPESDEAHISSLIRSLKQFHADHALLISTIDVFQDPANKVESDSPDLVNHHAYGRHRAFLEQEFKNIFPDWRIVRLPGLFGPGLKKNVIYDFLHHHELEKIDSRSVFQFYNVQRLWADLQRFLRMNGRILHLATEPVSVKEMARRCFGEKFINLLETKFPIYGFRSEFSAAWGKKDGFLYSREEVLREISDFVKLHESKS